MANSTGPQYARGDQGAPTASNRYPTGSPLTPSSDPAGFPQTGDPYAQQGDPYAQQGDPYAQYPAQSYPQQPYQDQPYPGQPYPDQRPGGYGDRRGTGPIPGREGEAYGYDYRYANGDVGDDRPGANATAWVALVLTVIALALTWDKFGAFIALPTRPARYSCAARISAG
jgi:hypothetical protein